MITISYFSEPKKFRRRCFVAQGTPPLAYRYLWKSLGRERKGEACAVLARGTFNSCLIRFADGFAAVTSCTAITRIR
jgi:hypothetical protein